MKNKKATKDMLDYCLDLADVTGIHEDRKACKGLYIKAIIWQIFIVLLYAILVIQRTLAGFTNLLDLTMVASVFSVLSVFVFRGWSNWFTARRISMKKCYCLEKKKRKDAVCSKLTSDNKYNKKDIQQIINTCREHMDAEYNSQKTFYYVELAIFACLVVNIIPNYSMLMNVFRGACVVLALIYSVLQVKWLKKRDVAEQLGRLNNILCVSYEQLDDVTNEEIDTALEQGWKEVEEEQ